MTQNDIDNRLQALLIEPSNKKIEKDISAYERRLNKAGSDWMHYHLKPHSCRRPEVEANQTAA